MHHEAKGKSSSFIHLKDIHSAKGEDVWEKKESFCTVVGNGNWCILCDKQYGGFSKKQKRAPYDPPVPLWVYFKGTENSISESSLHSHVHCTIIHNSRDMETT